METALFGVPAALGLSVASGMRATVTLAALAVLAYLDLIQLPSHLAVLAQGPVLVALLALAVAESLGDMVPGIDSLIHRFLAPVAMASGALAAFVSTGMVESAHPALPATAAVLAGSTAGVVHVVRRTTRPAMRLLLPTRTVSMAESTMAAGLIGSTLVSPWLVLALVVIIVLALIGMGFLAVRGLWSLVSWARTRISQQLADRHTAQTTQGAAPILIDVAPAPTRTSTSFSAWDLDLDDEPRPVAGD